MRTRLPHRLRRNAVGVLGRVEAAAGVGQIAIDVDQRVVGDRGQQRIRGGLRRFDQRQHELRLVVEHLLEVRHAPALVDRITMEAAAEVIAHAALGHRAERRHHHVAPALAAGRLIAGHVPGTQQQEQLGWTRKLRRTTEPAEALVESPREFVGGARQRLEAGDVERGALVGLTRLERRQAPDDDVRRGPYLGPILAPDAADLAQQIDEAGPPPAAGRREVGAAVERLQVGRQPDAHRPAALPRRRLHERHVDAIDVGPLFAIDLDRDAGRVEDGRDVGVLERLALHDVAPMARRVADRQENGDVAGARRGERVLAPRIPVDRVLRVLTQVRAGLDGEAVRHAGSAGRDDQARIPSLAAREAIATSGAQPAAAGSAGAGSAEGAASGSTSVPGSMASTGIFSSGIPRRRRA